MTEIKPLGITEQAYRRIYDMINSGEYNPGDKLPSQKELEAMLGISRPTLREAISRLISQDLIYSRQGKGYFVKEPSTRLLITIPAVESDRLFARSLFESRMFVEARLAQLAALYAEDSEIKELQELSALEENGAIPEDNPFGINAFHAKLASIAHNEIMAQFEYTLLNQSAELPDLFSFPTKGRFYSPDERYTHSDILKAVSDRNHVEAYNTAMLHVMDYAVAIGIRSREEFDYFRYYHRSR